MSQAKHDDAMLLMKVAEVSALRGMPSAANFLWSDEFDPNYEEFSKRHRVGSEAYGKAVLLATHYETLATFWKHGLIDEELLFDLVIVSEVWDRLREFVYAGRERLNNPRIGENFEALARAAARVPVAAG